jgi:uncharacterized membrane protein
MSEPIRVLLAGESWTSTSTHVKGWDFFSSSTYEEGHHYLEEALSGEEFAFEHLKGHDVSEHFPLSIEELDRYDVVVLSDIGANSLLLHPKVWLHGETVPNRLRLLADWVRQGGALVMCGGYLSFSGIYASAHYYRTPVEEVLPVEMFTHDDRMEAPHGARVVTIDTGHPIVSDLAEIDGDPFIASWDIGQGRSFVWTTDIGPHWCPQPFVTWEGYRQVWQNAVKWLARRDS